jgi:type II secretory pathway pseudopilin PulG
MVSQNPSVRRIGLTLVELLVVLAIIALLVALLLPVVSYVRKRGYESHCISNLRQLVIAWGLYAEDYKEYPAKMTLLQTYTKSREIYKCPSDPTSGLNAILTQETGFPVSYFNLDDDQQFRMKLREDPNHGVIVCILHGSRVSNLPAFIHNPSDWTGRIFRALHTGSVVQRQVPVRCYRQPTGGILRMRSFWSLFSDLPCPRELCSEQYELQEIPCF